MISLAALLSLSNHPLTSRAAPVRHWPHHPSKPHAPAWFVRQAVCVHSYEAPTWKWSPAFHPGYTYWNGYYTGLQFLASTWQRANSLLGMWTPPSTGNRRLIILHAYAIYRQDGNSWREWPNTARLCGLATG